jgi:hypothetical protein
VFLGRYDFDGDPQQLLRAYDQLMTTEVVDSVGFQVCITRDGGISVFDTCPSDEVFRAFSSSPQTREAFRAAGLPEPTVTPLGQVHRALSDPQHLRGAADPG